VQGEKMLRNAPFKIQDLVAAKTSGPENAAYGLNLVIR
jgi:hypothetical protein